MTKPTYTCEAHPGCDEGAACCCAGEHVTIAPALLDALSADNDEAAPTSAPSPTAAKVTRTCKRCNVEYVVGETGRRWHCNGCYTPRSGYTPTDRPPSRVARDEYTATLRHARADRRERTGKGNFSIARESLIDTDNAIAELQRARVELGDIPLGITKYERYQATIEPLARIDLVRRTCEELLERYGRSEAA